MSAPYGMTVGQLKALLASMPDSFDDKIVVLSRDSEGNGFETLGEVAVGWLRTSDDYEFRGFSPSDDDTWEAVENQATLDYTTDEDTEEYVSLDEDDHPAICLWP